MCKYYTGSDIYLFPSRFANPLLKTSRYIRVAVVFGNPFGGEEGGGVIVEAEKYDKQGERASYRKMRDSPYTLTQFANARASRYHSIFSSFYSPLHLHIHIYAGVPVVPESAFNAGIKQRVTPSNNSIKLRARARMVEGSHARARARANAITFVRRLSRTSEGM